MAQFTDSRQWKDAVEKGWALGAGDVASVDDDDIDDLLHCIEAGTPGECVSALSTLTRLVLDRMSPEQAAQLSGLVKAGAERALRSPGGDARSNEALLFAWFQADREAAVEQLLTLDLASLHGEAQKAAIYFLGCGGQATAKARLFALYHAGGNLGKEAEAALEQRGLLVPGPERIQEVAVRWRAEHRWQDLHWIYDYVIERLPPGSPIQPVLDILGTPSSAEGNEYLYSSEEGNVYLEADSDGILCGTHRS